MTTPDRKPRCRVEHLKNRNPCENEALDEFGICLHHLREISDYWGGVRASLIEQFPGLARILAEDQP